MRTPSPLTYTVDEAADVSLFQTIVITCLFLLAGCAGLLPHQAVPLNPSGELTLVCQAMQVDSGKITMPRLVWCPDRERVKALHKVFSNTLEMGDVVAFYLPAANTVVLSKPDCTMSIFRHELSHAVQWQTGRAQQMTPVEVEEEAQRITETLEGGK